MSEAELSPRAGIEALSAQPAAPSYRAISQQWAVAVALLLALWFVARPYVGIIHDGRLYMVQALNSVYPGRYSEDLYFKYGSQDVYTIFSLLYAPIVKLLGIWPAHMAMTAVGQMLWFAAALRLLAVFFPDRKSAIIAMAGVALFYSGYGGLGVFRYAEPFASPRLFAEAGVLAGLAAVLRGRHVIAWMLIAAACAVHPIMGLTGAAVVGGSYLRDRRMWIALAAGVAFVIVAAIAGWGPFGRLLLRYDNAWLQVVKQRSGEAFLTSWRLEDWLRTAGASGVLVVFSCIAAAKERRVVMLVGACCLAALLLAGVGSDIGNDILVADIQAWRILWLWTFMANAAMAIILLRVPKTGASRVLFAVLAMLKVVSAFFPLPDLILSLLTLYCCGIFAWEHFRRESLPRFVTAVLLVAPVAAAGLTAVFIWLLISTDKFWNPVLGCLIGTLVVLLIYTRGTGPRSLKFGVLAGLLLGLSVLRVDQRDDWRRATENVNTAPGLSRFLSGAGRVYWEGEDGLELLWLTAGQPSYYSCSQGTEGMFYRATAMDYARRSKVLKTLNTSSFDDQRPSACGLKADPTAYGPSTKAQVIAVCRTLPDLDSIVLMRPVPGTPSRRRWTAPAPLTIVRKSGVKERIQTFYQYRCLELR
jgi:hypothetical protein